MVALAKVHVHFWNSTKQTLFAGYWPKTKHYGAMFDVLRFLALKKVAKMEMFRALLPIMTRLSKIGVQDLEQLWYHRAPHHTLIHGDAHSANLAVGADVRILDWQTYRIGSPSFDVLYYLCTSTPLDDFVAHRRHLVALYVEKLCELGIKDVTVDDILSPIASVCTYALHILWVGGGLGMEEREQTRGVLAPLLLRMERIVEELGVVEHIAEIERQVAKKHKH